MQARKSERTVCSVYARENCAENHLSAHAGLQRCMQMEKMTMAESVRGIPEVAHSGAPPVLHGGHGCGQIRGRDPVPCTGIFRQIGLPASFGNDRNGKTYRAGRDFASFSGRVKHPGTPEKREWRQGYGFWTDFRQNGASFCGVSRPIQQGMPCPACLTASGH